MPSYIASDVSNSGSILSHRCNKLVKWVDDQPESG